ncbi:MAG TPA: trehalose-phosphatase [Candidatus Kapabacteria bacterium]|nr:trehalose-phosphatase [Candidatus Kapabacteria bacterium]
MLTQYRLATNTLLLLDYDGTLTGFKTKPELAIPSGDVLGLLSRLSQHSSLKVVITTGRSPESIDALLGSLPIDIIAEHGTFIKQSGSWAPFITVDTSWKPLLLPILQAFVTKCDGAFIEEKTYSLAWHYRSSDPATGYILSRKLISLLHDHLLQHDLRILDGSKTVEILSTKAGKGKIVETYIKTKPYDYIISIGDDKTDEELFHALADNPNALTVKVGYEETVAKTRLGNPDEVLRFLQEL